MKTFDMHFEGLDHNIFDDLDDEVRVNIEYSKLEKSLRFGDRIDQHIIDIQKPIVPINLVVQDVQLIKIKQ